MAILRKVKPVELYMGKLPYGADLLEELNDICKANNIRLGKVEALGAVQRARFGFYNQKAREYQYLLLKKPLEITKLVGNISLLHGDPFVHAHISLADENGEAIGGHLASGTIIFACEFILQAFDGPTFERAFDNETGLQLWNINEK